MRRISLLSIAATTALVLTACGGGGDADEKGPSAEGFPLAVDSCGEEITVEEPAERIYSANYEMTHTLLALGLADRIVAAGPWAETVTGDRAADAESLETIEDATSEAVLDLDPDLVVGSWNPFDYGLTNPELFESLDIPVYISPTECANKEQTGDSDAAERTELLDVEVFFTEVEQLASMAGHPERGTDLVADFRERLAVVAEQDFGDTDAMVWYANPESPTVAGCCGASGIILDQLGLTNVFEDQKAEWPSVGWEDVADRDPDVIVFADLGQAEETIEFLKSNPVTSTLDAVVNERYIAVDSAALVSSVAMIEAIEQIAAALPAMGIGS
ncbi:MAG: ABC transporter substrate-binding protein [Aeromicrobium sp.]|uniref:ABC transporter substrate-binding protein n=1 Tax=Aeromicrobium sp. TaxID=1871063 RepID=UPI0039E6A57A